MQLLLSIRYLLFVVPHQLAYIGSRQFFCVNLLDLSIDNVGAVDYQKQSRLKRRKGHFCLRSCQCQLLGNQSLKLQAWSQNKGETIEKPEGVVQLPGAFAVLHRAGWFPGLGNRTFYLGSLCHTNLKMNYKFFIHLFKVRAFCGPTNFSFEDTRKYKQNVKKQLYNLR